ncbi:hypothetical protein [Vibrio sp. PNB22_4_1]
MENHFETNLSSTDKFVLFYTALSNIEGMTCNAVLLLSHWLHLTKLLGNDYFQYSADTAKNQLALTSSQFKTSKQLLSNLGLIHIESTGVGKCDSIKVDLDSLINRAELNSCINNESADIDSVLTALMTKPKSSEMFPVIRFFPSLVLKHGLSIVAALLLNQIKYRSNLRQVVMYSTNRLAKELACGRAKIQSARQSLIEQKLLNTSHHGRGNHLVYELTFEAYLLCKQMTKSNSKTNNKPKSSTKNDRHLTEKNRAKKSTHQVNTSTPPSENQHSLKEDQISNKIFNDHSQILVSNYDPLSQYTAIESLALMESELWRKMHMNHINANVQQLLSQRLKNINRIARRDKKTIADWITHVEHSMQYDRSLLNQSKAQSKACD